MNRYRIVAIHVLLCCLTVTFYAAKASNSEPVIEASYSSATQDASPADVANAIRGLSSPNAAERATAACLLQDMGSRAAAAIPYLIRMLGDDTPVGAIECGRNKMRRFDTENNTPGKQAAFALASIGKPAVEPLLGVVRDRDYRVRQNALLALGVIKDERTVEPLLSGLQDSEAQVRAQAAWGLGLKQDRRVVEPLIAALYDGDHHVRKQTAWALGLQGDERAVEPLSATLRDSSPDVREQAAWALGLKGDQRSVEPLVVALQDSQQSVRQQAAWALGLKGDSRADEPIVVALKDGSPAVREQAAWALGLKGDHRSIEALNTAMKDESKAVRKNAAWALGLILMRDGKAGDKLMNLDLNIDLNFNTEEGESKRGARRKPTSDSQN